MRCPYCGSPVMIRGSSWECGWCGDYGSFRSVPNRRPAQKPAPEPIPDTLQLTLKLSFFYQVDLAETWGKLKKALEQLAPTDPSLLQLLGRVLLYHISVGIQHKGALTDAQKTEELQSFLQNTADLNLGKGAEEILRDARQGILFREEAALSETDCGTFWTELLSLQPAEDYYHRNCPDGLEELFFELSSAYAYFGGKKDEELGEAQDYQFALQKAYDTLWQNKVLLHPDAERAKRLLAEGKFPENEDICREILLVEYPEEAPHETAEALEDFSWEYILDDVFSRNTAKGVQMWRCLLDIAEPSLKADPKAAKMLLPDWNWLDSPSRDQALPLLLALDNERFMSQLFESASIDRLQRDILNACRDYGQEALGQRCLALALKNPHLEEYWRKHLKRVFTEKPSYRSAAPRPAAAGKPITDKKADGGTVYHYCSVQVPGTHRPYAYLTGGLPLKAGDWVELPFAKDDVLQQGQVKSVMDCTRRVAPWPPELTKTVIRIIDAPPAGQTEKEPPAPPPQGAKAKQPKAAAALAAPVMVDGKRHAVSKKPFSFKMMIAAALTVAVLAGGALVLIRNKHYASAYEAALQALSNGNYVSATQGFSKLSGYRDAAPLYLYCRYANAYECGTNYIGGLNELSGIQLRYDTVWQRDIDALAVRVKGYKAEKDAAEEQAAAEAAAKREQELKNQYAGKLPVEGMPMSCLKYTALGAPDEEEKCLNFDSFVEDRRSISVRWYGSSGEVLAAGTCTQQKGDPEFMLRSFHYYGSSVNSNEQPFYSGGGGSPSGGLRDDYDSPEDLWEDNQDWYEDEDEAWDAWYDD